MSLLSLLVNLMHPWIKVLISFFLFKSAYPTFLNSSVSQFQQKY